MSQKKISKARAILRQARIDNVADALPAAEGLACLTNAKPEYLCNLIKMDHPDRIKAVQIIELSDDES